MDNSETLKTLGTQEKGWPIIDTTQKKKLQYKENRNNYKRK